MNEEQLWEAVYTSLFLLSTFFARLFAEAIDEMPTSVHINPYMECETTEKYKDVVVCIAENPFDPPTDKVGGVYYWGTIYVNKKHIVFKELILKHEYCHHMQYIEGRKYDEMECYIKMFFQ